MKRKEQDLFYTIVRIKRDQVCQGLSRPGTRGGVGGT